MVSAVSAAMNQWEEMLWLDVSAERSFVSREFCILRGIMINEEEDWDRSEKVMVGITHEMLVVEEVPGIGMVGEWIGYGGIG